ncbi:MAG: UDP-N-acetylmuramoyl-tripeptide--D-alanyl-D-alanine ligase [Hyphomicrobiales bacterium]
MRTLENLYNYFKKEGKISIDSRNITEGCIFFALKGERFDGNEFAKKAIKQGAAYAVVDNPKYAIDERFILVDDVLNALQQFARYHRLNSKAIVIGITGSNGKTTTKELIACVMEKKYNIIYTQGNLNNHIGVPLTLLDIEPDTEIAIVEMGANHIGEIAILCEIARPDYGLITNIGKAHLEGFGSLKGVIQAKSELYNFLEENKGFAFVNGDNKILLNKSANISRKCYGSKTNNGLTGHILSSKNNTSSSQGYLTVSITIRDEQIRLTTNLIGSYNLENVLAACLVGEFFNIQANDIIHAIEEYIPQNNRSQLINCKGVNIIMDAYNANPVSMNAALENFSDIKAENKIAIIGDMKELGKDSKLEHKVVLDKLSSFDISKVFLVGEEFYSFVDSGFGFYFHQDVDALNQQLETETFNDEYILIKGSRSIKLEKALEVIKKKCKNKRTM